MKNVDSHRQWDTFPVRWGTYRINNFNSVFFFFLPFCIAQVNFEWQLIKKKTRHCGSWVCTDNITNAKISAKSNRQLLWSCSWYVVWTRFIRRIYNYVTHLIGQFAPFFGVSRIYDNQYKYIVSEKHTWQRAVTVADTEVSYKHWRRRWQKAQLKLVWGRS